MKNLILVTLLLFASIFGGTKQLNFDWNDLDTAMSKISVDTGKITIDAKRINLDTLSIAPEWKSGQIWNDTANLTTTTDMGIEGVRGQGNQELMKPPVWNNSGSMIPNCTPVYASGVFNGMLTIDSADARYFNRTAQFVGLTTHDCPADSKCLVTKDGNVNECDTGGFFTAGPLWLDTAGGSNNGLTQSQPLVPRHRLFIGTVLVADASNGVINVDYSRITRNDLSKSYTFTSQGINAGDYWSAGWYDFSATNVTLSEGSTTVQYGVVNITRGAHASIVPSGPGTVVGGGQVGMRVTGVMDYEDGTIQAAGQTDTITTDITTLNVDQYYETPAKWSSNPTWELYIVSGTPTSYSLTFNIGLSKYDDMGDTDFTIKGFECTWQGNSINSTYDLILYKHSQFGWTYAASGFVPGNTVVAQKSVDKPIAGLVTNDINGAYKRTNLNAYIAGESGEGFVIKHITGANNTIQIEPCHIEIKSEELE